MKVIKRARTEKVYKAKDGQIFYEKEDCKFYEWLLNNFESNYTFFTYDGKEVTFKEMKNNHFDIKYCVSKISVPPFLMSDYPKNIFFKDTQLNGYSPKFPTSNGIFEAKKDCDYGFIEKWIRVKDVSTLEMEKEKLETKIKIIKKLTERG